MRSLKTISLLTALLFFISTLLSCTIGSGNDKARRPKDSGNYIITVPTTGQKIKTDQIKFKDTMIHFNNDSILVRAAYYHCPCGETGVIVVPYFIDTIF